MEKESKKSEDRNLILFFVITLAWTWICGFIPVIFGITGTPIGTFVFCFGGGAPSVVGLFLVFLTYSKDQRKDYFKRCFSLKYMGWKWPLIVFLIFSVISIICKSTFLLLIRLFMYDISLLILNSSIKKVSNITIPT